ncbi:hypothetical protein TRVL_03109 [Trypanosoma vivax]|nr:hypothetical protein TRVL_03109 [Trypanosoma vivax]
MGILGLRKFIDSASCTKFLPAPGEEEECVVTPCATGHWEHRERRTMPSSLPTEMESASTSASAAHVDHVLVDLNCIVHSCFRQSTLSTSVATKRDLIQSVLKRLEFLLTRVAIPSVSLTICIDGPAPLAKLQTQRLRRRQVGLLSASGLQLTTLAITPGSLFLVELENALAAQFKLNGGRGFLHRYIPVFLHGSTVDGEGEAKVARALAYLATAGFSHRNDGQYSPNDTVVVIGNDIDLTLTCMGATQYHNLFIVGPSSMQLINVSEIIYRWLRNGIQSDLGQSCREFVVTAEHLASVRIDFVFLFLLNGGDHYVGAGEVAHVLWRRYRLVRGASNMQRCLVSDDLTSVDVDFLAEVLQSADYTGEADAKVGMELLRATLWSLKTTVTGVCPDYWFIPSTAEMGGAGGPNLAHARAAVAFCQRKRRPIHFVEDKVDKTRKERSLSNGKRAGNSKKCVGDDSADKPDATKPLTPLETFIALMPTEASLPSSISKALRSSHKYDDIIRSLLGSHDTYVVADAARRAVQAAEDHLTISERCMRDFTNPVQINVRQLPRRLSRHEQHRMIAARGAWSRNESMPVVQRISMPVIFQYLNVEYPSHVSALLFFSPFHSQDTECNGAPVADDEECAIKPENKSNKSETTKNVIKDSRLRASAQVREASCCRETSGEVCVEGSKTGEGKSPVESKSSRSRPRSSQSSNAVRSIPVRVGVKQGSSATGNSGEMIFETSDVRTRGGRRRKADDKQGDNLRQQHSAQHGCAIESEEDARCHLLRGNDKGFLDEIKKFLGDKKPLQSLLDGDGVSKRNRKRRRNRITKAHGVSDSQPADAPPGSSEVDQKRKKERLSSPSKSGK